MQNFWDASCHDGDVGEPLKAQQQQQQASAFNSSCVTHEQADYCTPTTDSFVHCERSPARLNPIINSEIDPVSSSATAMQRDGRTW